MQEELGYIEGGSETLIRRLTDRIAEMGGRLHLSAPVQRITAADGAVTGLIIEGIHRPFAAVISTAPLILLPRLAPDLPDLVKAQYAALRNIGCACVVHKLRRPMGKDFWINTNDPRIEIPGLVQFSNLRPLGADHVVYTPYYMPITTPKWSWTDERLIAQSYSALQLINPALTGSGSPCLLGCSSAACSADLPAGLHAAAGANRHRRAAGGGHLHLLPGGPGHRRERPGREGYGGPHCVTR